MDPITQQYSQTAQKELIHIEQVGEAFRQRCEQLRLETEQKIAAIDSKAADFKNQENLLKLALKRSLDVMIDQFEKEIRNSFTTSIVNLEAIYRQKELIKLQQIAEEILS